MEERTTVNRKVAGSIPARRGPYVLSYFVRYDDTYEAMTFYVYTSRTALATLHTLFYCHKLWIALLTHMLRDSACNMHADISAQTYMLIIALHCNPYYFSKLATLHIFRTVTTIFIQHESIIDDSIKLPILQTNKEKQ